LGEAPARTAELSQAVSNVRTEIEKLLSDGGDVSEWIVSEMRLPTEAAQQIADYFADTYRALGALPSQQALVIERFFDDSGGTPPGLSPCRASAEARKSPRHCSGWNRKIFWPQSFQTSSRVWNIS